MSSRLVPCAPMPAVRPGAALLRSLVIGLTAFLTVVDLFATQAILPSLTRHYGVSPAAMALAVNACTLGMAAAGLLVALLGRGLDRRLGVLASLALLALPTTLLAHAPDLASFALLRVAQGLCMSAAFTLTLAYLAEQCSAEVAGSAFAAYITGNVASNLVGRLVSAGVADHFGLAWNFYLFALLNLAGALLVWFALRGTRPLPISSGSPLLAWRRHLAAPALRAAFALGFCILFAFIGTFTFVNYLLVGADFGLMAMELGLVYLVFLPSVLTTPLAGRAVKALGTRGAARAGLALAALGLPLLLLPVLAWVMAGLALVAIGTFFAQAVATGFVGRAATAERGAASGLYLASYFIGGLAGSALLGQVFDRLGWPATVAGIGLALALGALLTAGLRLPPGRES
jgi:YNFM family putative membrane transporter